MQLIVAVVMSISPFLVDWTVRNRRAATHNTQTHTHETNTVIGAVSSPAGPGGGTPFLAETNPSEGKLTKWEIFFQNYLGGGWFDEK